MPAARATTTASRQRRLGPALCAAICLLATTGCLPDRLSDAEIDQAIAEASHVTSCAAQVDCALAAGCADDATCRADCSKGATGLTAEHVASTLSCRDTCVERDCKALSGTKRDECAKRCLVYSCARELLTCADPEPIGTAICTDIFGCLSSCLTPAAGGSAACFGSCAANLAPAEFVLARKVADCMTIAIGNNKPFTTTCSAEVATCYAGGVSGSAECFEAFGCAETCAKLGRSAATCGRECIGTLNVSAQSAYINYAQCLTDTPGAPKACDPDFVACADPSGTMGCSAGGDEIQKCIAKSGTEAALSCMAIGVHQCKPLAAKPLVDYVRCFTENCANACPKATSPGCALCLTTKCKPQAEACNKS